MLKTMMMTVGCLILSGVLPASAQDGGLKVSSPSFGPGEKIPRTFTCEGEDVSPALTIENIPSAAKTLALIVDDPDAPRGMWVHWVVYNIPPVGEIKEDVIPGLQGWNDFGREAYGGPCPPSGTHRYFFKVYALDTEIPFKKNMTKTDLETAMMGHILAQGELMGVYKRG